MAKRDALLSRRCLNHNPDKVKTPLFHENEFFDPEDKIQVKYEMLRSVATGEANISEASSLFGFSRPAFYAAQQSFSQEGVIGLADEKRGRKKPYKVTPEIRKFILEQAKSTPRRTYYEISQAIKGAFDIEISPRTVRKIVTEAGLGRAQG